MQMARTEYPVNMTVKNQAMKTLTSVIVTLLFASCEMLAQTGGQVVIGGQAQTVIGTGAGAPSGNCPGLNYLYVNTSDGTVYSCSNRSSRWVAVGSVPIKSSHVLPNIITGMNVFGDSIAVAANYGVQYATQGFGYLTAAALGVSVSKNFAVPGAIMNGFVAQAYLLTPSTATASIAIIGSNDAAAGVPTCLLYTSDAADE